MHVGLSVIFQNPGGTKPDRDIYAEELVLAKQAEPLGFDSIWSVEHHFTDYTMCPNVFQFLTYMAGCTEKIQLGSMVAVLPWHDPLRVAEQVAMLDVLSNGRTVLGMGRGTGRIEFEGFRVAMPEARGRFAETAEMLLNGLEQGFCEYDGKYVKQPRVDLRPRPYKSFKGRTYAAAISTESAEIMAKMGVGILIVPQKPWPVVQKELTQYRSTFFAATGEQAPGPYCAGWMFIDDSADRAEEMARRYIGAYWDSVIDHYEFNKDHLKNTAGYEFHGEMYDRLNAPGGMQKMTDFYVDLQIWGTPDQVFDKVQTMRENTLADGFMAVCSYGGMPHDEANRNMQQFAKDVMPELKKLTPLEAPLEQTA
ncbi:MAG: LLM class flavin-dependent oxidoreductase [Pseudomonadales bacterium]|jgi:alkanesulfonate monooxygenase SsuD/methylene tetrahydromethanopterin reductase-like flavin-dependent oxidoreductase (luciferase family)